MLGRTRSRGAENRGLPAPSISSRRVPRCHPTRGEAPRSVAGAGYVRPGRSFVSWAGPDTAAAAWTASFLILQERSSLNLLDVHRSEFPTYGMHAARRVQLVRRCAVLNTRTILKSPVHIQATSNHLRYIGIPIPLLLAPGQTKKGTVVVLCCLLGM